MGQKLDERVQLMLALEDPDFYEAFSALRDEYDGDPDGMKRDIAALPEDIQEQFDTRVLRSLVSELNQILGESMMWPPFGPLGLFPDDFRPTFPQEVMEVDGGDYIH